ncbi:MAG: ATP-binding protein [Thalassotalea sp.]|nr:ATP-binding protein [Thalassotalea sp.]
MSGLKRIVLIDTHLPGLVELKVDGHTNICGTNASGKTTLQRLIPVFYGESPNKVVPATRDNFQTWYLPRESSFIIYEYQRLDSKMCMVVLTSSTTGVVYRLIEKGFDVSDFIGKDIAGSHSIAITEIIRNFKRDNIVTSKVLNTKEFRSVIQNDRAVMALSSNKRDLLTAARYFSLCESDARLRHIEKLIKAVHSKEGKMETIKAMIAAILEEDGVETPSNKISKSHVDEWIKECQLIKEFDLLMPTYKKLQNVDAKLEQTETRLSQLKQQISIDLSFLSEAIIKAENDHGVYKQQFSDLTTNFEQSRDSLNREVSAAKGDVQNAEQHLDKIEEDFNHWQDQDIETHQANIDNIPSWQSQLQSLNEQHTLLTAEHQDVEAAYHKRLAEIEKKQSKELAQLNSQKDTASTELRSKQVEENNIAQNIKTAQSERWLESSTDFDRQINSSKLNLQKVKTEIDLSGPTSAEQQAMNLQEAAVDEAQASEDHARSELSSLQDELQQAKYQQMASHEKLNKARNVVNTAKQRLTQVEAWLYPGDNTLLEFLRKDYPGWENQLGKVINPELLSRTDLAPAFSEAFNINDAAKSTLYGVLVDTDVINDSEQVQTQTQLQQQFDVAEQELIAARNVQNEREVELEKINKQVQEFEQKLTNLSSQCQFKEQTRKRVQDERAQLKAEHKQALVERKKQGQQSLGQLQKSLDKLLLSRQQAEDDHKEQCHEEKMEHELHWQQLLGDIEQKLEQIKSQLQQAQQDHKDDLKTCKKWYKDELASREVDVEQIASLKQSISKLKDDIEITNKHRDSVADYKRWYDLVFTKQKATHQTTLSKAKELKAKAERMLDEKSSIYHQQKKELQQQLGKLEKALTELRELANGINGLKPQFALLTLPKTEVVSENSTANARLVEAKELFEQQRRASKDIDDYVAYFDNAIGQKSGISLTETWEHSRRDCLTENHQGLQVLNSRKMVAELERLLTVLVPQHLEGVRNNGLNFGNDLTQYYNVLADIDKRIVSQSKRISKEVDQELFLDGVSDSRVKIRSKISEFDFWPKLIRFNKLHQAWLNDVQASLPDEEYMQTIREVLDVLGRATVSSGISQLLDIELHLKEGHSELIIRTDRQLNESSSHGMAYLILCKFLLAFTRLLRGHSQAVIHWPIDEIGTLANKNVKKIFDACKANQITVLGAFPNPESDVLHFFENRYLIDKDAPEQKLRMVQPKVNPISERIKQLKQTEDVL